ncbi:MAG TPA: efflux transporter outer membrane subunit [Novosphingobium sp.]|nr:efflux transporter outer membrane subunit [Novosphingobium sp.]
MFRLATAGLSLALVLAGCAAHQDMPAPAVAGAAGHWIDAGPAGPLAANWWQGLGDAQLDALVARALAANPDLAEAEARLRSARASVEAARGRSLPQVNATGSATTNAQSGNGMIPFGRLPGVTRTYDLFDAGFDASWELDLWGGRASAVRAAAARADVAAAKRAGSALSVAAEVVRLYTELRGDQARRTNLAAQEEALTALLALQQARFSAGEAPRDESLGTSQRLDALRASLASAEADTAAAAYGLAVLTGQPPEAMGELLAKPAPIPATPEVALIGLRSEVLARRPDVRAAAAELLAYRADADVAHAALFPSLSLTGSIGQQARTTGDFTAANSLRYGFGPSLHWPVFAGGQLRGQLRGARAESAAAAARYEKAVLTALSDSETAANRLARAAQAQAATQNAAAAAEQVAVLAGQRFDHGEDTRLQALEARLSALMAEGAALAARTSHVQAYAALGKALGAS